MQSTSIQSPATGRLIFLCFLVAVFEGVDIQAMGVAAPALAAAFHLKPAQMGEVMSASTVGLMLGAAAGGWLSDRIGRARVIVIAMAVLSVFSFATVAAPGYVGLRIIRVLAGLGFGRRLPQSHRHRRGAQSFEQTGGLPGLDVYRPAGGRCGSRPGPLPGRRLVIGIRSFMLAASDRCCSFPLFSPGFRDQTRSTAHLPEPGYREPPRLAFSRCARRLA